MAIQDWKQLRELLMQKQQGNTEEVSPGQTAAYTYDEEDKKRLEELNSYLYQNSKQRAESREAYGAMLNASKQAMAELARQGTTDYGAYEGDFAVPFGEWIQDPINYRANSQSELEKLRNGSIKFIPYAASTFLDNTIGLAAGLLGIGYDAFDGNGFRPLNSFINNPFSEAMQRLKEWSDKVLPNYRTTEEIEDADEWWKHLNANFWGDTFIKNLGFTVGAGAAGGLYARGFRALQGKLVNSAYKTALAAAEGSADAEAAFQKILQGRAMQNPGKIYNALERSRQSFERLRWESQLVGGLLGAVGESRTEAMQAAKEFRDEYLARERQKFEQQRENIVSELISSGYVSEVPVYDGYGRQVGTKTVLNSTGQKILEERLRAVSEDFAKNMQQVNMEAERLANGTFGLNMPLLWGSNVVMFGRMMSGGFNTQARTAVKGMLGKYVGKGTVLGAIGKGLYNAGVEGFEEISQKVFSEGEKDIAKKNMAAFYNKQYDKDAIKDTADWLLSMAQSTGDVLGQGSSWEEFAVGALTGALGMPTRRGWAGGIIGGIQEGMANKRASEEAAKKLNETFQSEEFQTRWKNMVRHKALENLKEVDLKSENRFAWHTHNFEQIMGDIMMYADAGRLNDLEAFVDSISNMSMEDINKFRADFSDPNNPQFDRKTNYELKEWLSTRADEVKTAINQYRRLYDAVDYLSFGTSDKEAINELIYTQAQLENFERRYNKIIGSVLDRIRPALEDAARETVNDRPSEKAQKARNLLESEERLRNLFGGLAIDIHASEQDKDSSILGMTLYELDEEKKEQALNLLNDLGVFTKNKVTRDELRDLQKLVKSRQEYYVRLFDPKGRRKFLEDFQRDAVNPEDVAEDIANQDREKRVKEQFAKLTGANNIGEYLKVLGELDALDPEGEDMLKQMAESDPKISGFEQQLDDAFAFQKSIGESVALKASESNDDEFKALADEVQNALSNINVETVLANAPEGSDTRLEIARTLLDLLKANRRAHNIAAAVLKEKINDIMKANGLGEIPDEGNGQGGGTGQGQGSGGGNVSQFDRLKELIDNITDPANSVLNDLATGDFSKYDDLSDNEKLRLAATAAAKIDELKASLGLIAIEDDKVITRQNEEKEFDKSDPRRVNAHKELVRMDQDSIGGTPFTVYTVGDLKKGKLTKYVANNKQTNETLDWMRAHNVQEFIDTGALATLNEYYESGKDPELPKKLPIYFIANPHISSSNPFAVKNKGESKTKYPTAVNVMLAVEMNDKNRSILSKYANAGVFSNDTLVTVYEEGHPVQYQVIGEVWNPSTKEIEKREKSGVEYGIAGEGQVYEAMKQRANKIWDHTIDKSILPQYNRDTRTSKDNIPEEGKWYVARIHPVTGDENSNDGDLDVGKKIHTTLNYIMSGRNITKDSNDELTAEDKISIEEPLREYGKYHDGEVYFAMPTSKGMVYTAGSPQMDTASIDAPPGSLWMATRGANGAWNWTCISIARAGEKIKEDSSLMNRARKDMEVLFKESMVGQPDYDYKLDFKNRLDAAIDLSHIYYVGKGNSIVPSFDDSNRPVVYVCGVICRNPDDIFDALEAAGCRFQVDDDAINNRPMMRELIKAGVLKSEMRSFVRKGASIGINPLEDVDADGSFVDVHVVDSTLPVARTAGSSLVSGYSKSGSVSDINIRNVNYRYDEKDGTVTKMTGKLRVGQKIEDRNIIAAVRVLAQLMSDPSHFAGKKWKVEERYVYPGKNGQQKKVDIQYTEMYEDEYAGIRVRVTKNGTNGAYRLVIDNSFWDSLMQVAKPVAEFGKPQTDERAELEELQRRRDEELASEEGGTIQSKPEGKPTHSNPAPAPGGKRTRRRASLLDEEDDDDASIDLGDAIRGAQEKMDEQDCG